MIRDPHLSNQPVPDAAGCARGLVLRRDRPRGIGHAGALVWNQAEAKHRQSNAA